MSDNIKFPPQMLSFSKKNKTWRKQHLDWADQKTFMHYSPVRKSVMHKKINYDLLNGKLHMNDFELIINPDHIQANYIPDQIQHYPIINSKLQVLAGESLKRPFDFKVVVTNPTAISEIEKAKTQEIMQKLQQMVANTAQSQEEYQQELEKLNDYYNYEWQDYREVRANQLLNHYIKEYNMPLMFKEGFMDAMAVGEEIYRCDIIGGEPTIERVNPNKLRVFRSGFSNKIEDADMLIYEDYWSVGRIMDTYYDVLTTKDQKYLENLPDTLSQGMTDSMDNTDERGAFVNNYMIGDEITKEEGFFWDPLGITDGVSNNLLPYDNYGNVRVIQVYWKSKRKIKKVRSYDPATGEEMFDFYPENYMEDKVNGEEVQTYWINEAWEGTKIGADIYVNMRPRVIQYNRLSNPSRCHFGFVGSLYNLNDSRPFSMVDMMKPFNYLYDAIHDRLNKAIANNWGSILELDTAMVPKGWDIEKWLYFAKVNKLAVKNSFNEGEIGQATGKLAGSYANNNKGIISASDGNYIQQLMNLLEYIKQEMSEVIGISKQREGQISNRETVGGVERSTLQSSYITEWLFAQHDDVRKRALECFLETAKIAMRGTSQKFQYILSDTSQRVMEIDGDEFAECDYGILVDNSNNVADFNSKIETLAQAALQNQSLDFSTIMKLYSSCSMVEKQRMIEKNEKQLKESQQQQMQQQQELQQQQIQAQQAMKERELQQREDANIRDNETRIAVANIQKESYQDWEGGFQDEYTQEDKDNLREKIREFDERLKLDREKLEFEKKKTKKDQELKLKQINKPTKSASK